MPKIHEKHQKPSFQRQLQSRQVVFWSQNVSRRHDVVLVLSGGRQYVVDETTSRRHCVVLNESRHEIVVLT